MISTGTLEVLAALSELSDGAGTWSDINERCELSESAVYMNLEQLAGQDVIRTEAVHRDGYALTVYELEAEDLGAAAKILLEELR